MKKLLSMLAFLPLLAMSQTPVPQKFTLQQALDYAKANYPLIKARQAQKDKAEAELKFNKTDYLPNLSVQDQYLFGTSNSVTGTYFSNDGLSIPVSGGIRANNVYQGAWDGFTTLFVNWNIFSFGKVRAEVQTAEQVVNQAQLNIDNETFQQQVKVADAYLLYTINRKLTTVQQRNLERAQVVHDGVIAVVSSGLRPGADSSFVEAELSKAKLLLLQSQEVEQEQKSHLASLLALQTSDFEVDTAIYNQSIPAQIKNPVVSMDNNPLIMYYNSYLQIDLARGKLINKTYMPSVSFVGGGWARGSGINNATGAISSSFADGAGYQVYNYMVGLSLKWSVTGLFKMKQDYNANRAQYFTDSYLLQEQKVKLNEALQTSRMKEQLALAQAKEAPIQLNSATQSYYQANARYQSGLSTLPEYYQAYYLLNRAEIDQSVANNNVWRALLLSAAATGDLNLFTSQITK